MHMHASLSHGIILQAVSRPCYESRVCVQYDRVVMYGPKYMARVPASSTPRQARHEVPSDWASVGVPPLQN